MTISRWKMMACTLGLTVGGLAFVAGQSNNKLNAQWEIKDAKPPQATTPPAVQPPATTATVLTAPAIVLPAPQDFAFPVPAVPANPIQTTSAIELELIPEPATTGPEALPFAAQIKATEPVSIDAPIEVSAGTKPAPPAPVFAPAPMAFLEPAAAPVAVVPNPPTVDVPVARPPVTQSPLVAPVFVQPPAAPAPQAAAPVAPPMVTAPPHPPMATNFVPPPVVSQAQPPQVLPVSKLKMLLRLGDGKPRFEIRTNDSTDVLFKVYGEKVEMQAAPDGVKNSPIAGVTAMGKVRFAGPGIEGTCDSLSVLSGTGEVLLKGNVHMKTKRGKAWSEMTAEKLIYQIGASGLTTPAVTPAAYQENR